MRRDLGEQRREPREPAEVDDLGRVRVRRDARGQPRAERRGGQLGRVQEVEHAGGGEPLGADELLDPRGDAGHDEHPAADVQQLADGVVAAHADDVVDAGHEGAGVVDEGQQPHLGARGDDAPERGPVGGRHERAGDEDAGRPRRQGHAGERLGEREAVLAAADEAEREPAVRQLLPLRRIHAPGGAAEVAGEPDPAGQRGVERVLDGRVVHGAVAVDPDRVEALAHDALGVDRRPLAAGRDPVVEDLAQPEDERRPVVLGSRSSAGSSSPPMPSGSLSTTSTSGASSSSAAAMVWARRRRSASRPMASVRGA